jgi:hypothetical protein
MRRFGTAKRVEKFAHFRAIGVVQHDKSTIRRKDESAAFTRRHVCRMRIVAIVSDRRGNAACVAGRK